jgi:hypothetical protein
MRGQRCAGVRHRGRENFGERQPAIRRAKNSIRRTRNPTMQRINEVNIITSGRCACGRTRELRPHRCLRPTK